MVDVVFIGNKKEEEVFIGSLKRNIKFGVQYLRTGKLLVVVKGEKLFKYKNYTSIWYAT